jgi:hypothetical protein
VREGADVKTVPACLSVFRIGPDGKLELVHKYDVDTRDQIVFWMEWSVARGVRWVSGCDHMMRPVLRDRGSRRITISMYWSRFEQIGV